MTKNNKKNNQKIVVVQSGRQKNVPKLTTGYVLNRNNQSKPRNSVTYDLNNNLQLAPFNTNVQQPGIERGLTGGLQRTRKSKRSLPQFTVAQLDPFCPEAQGVKVPDDATAPSAVAFSRDLQPLNTGTTGGAGLVFRYHPVAAFVSPTVSSSTTWTWPVSFASTNVANQGTLAANFNAARVVSFGVKLSCRQSILNASGFVHVALVPEVLDGSTWQYPTSVAAMEYAPYYRRIPLADLARDDVIIPSRYTDHTAFRYIDTANPDTITNFRPATTGWMAILVWVEGPISMPSALDVDIIHNYEALASNPSGSGTGGILAITAPAPYSPGIMAATDYTIQNSEPVRVIAENQEDTPDFWNTAKSLYGAGVKIASGMIPVISTIASLL